MSEDYNDRYERAEAMEMAQDRMDEAVVRDALEWIGEHGPTARREFAEKLKNLLNSEET